MKYVRRTVNAVLLLLTMRPQYPPVGTQSVLLRLFWFLLCMAVFVGINLRPIFKSIHSAPTKRIWYLNSGCELLRLFLITATISAAFIIARFAMPLQNLLRMPPEMRRIIIDSRMVSSHCILALVVASLLHACIVILMEAILFWNGMIRVYLTSVQLGVKHRILAALCGWIPGVNIWYLMKIIRITASEAEFETEKWELDDIRAESAICKTRYPLLMVHGVFFRDFRYLNYWGRIPKELMRNGATVYYGGQQSAAAVEESGKELAARIRQIVEETGCEKVNIIAHSKGGLDSRAAIAHCGCAPYVASLTTVNTPHRGCIFAEVLLNKMPQAARQRIAAAYNAALKRLGDENPDFLAAVTDLTESACLARNACTPDAEGVLYESVTSYCRRAQNGKFPMNVTYPVVRHFDGRNDGLVAVESAKWGSAFTLLEPPGKRGVSHGDVVDLNRENIPGFDVREFYVHLVASLRERGY